jgi:hypothetical protein
MPAFITPVPQYAGEYPQFFIASIKGRHKLMKHDPDSTELVEVSGQRHYHKQTPVSCRR